MSQGTACRNRAHRDRWVVTMRKHNRSAFSGGRRTTSDYSEIVCATPDCRARWRSKAAFVDDLPDAVWIKQGGRMVPSDQRGTA